MTAKVDILISATDKASNVIENVGKSSGSLSTKWTELSSKINLLTTGIGGVVDVFEKAYGAVKQNIDEYSNYVESVDKMSMATGMASEETSRLIQLADDFRVEQGALTTAMKMALQNGFEPTVDNLADLSDKYLTMTSVTERASMMQDIFGRQWVEMVPMLEKGGDAIREAADGIGDGLVVTQDAIEQNREYIKSVDDLTDSWTAFKYSITKDALPALTELLSANAKSISMMNEGASRTEVIEQRRRDLAAATYDWADAEREAMVAANATTQAQAEATDTQQQTIDVTNQQAWAIDAMAESYEGAGRAAALAAQNASQMAAASNELADAQTKLADAEASWKSREGGDVASMLDKNSMSASQYEAGLAAIDSAMGTTLRTEYQLTTAQEELAQKYASGQITAGEFAKGLENLNDTFMPLNESIQKSMDLVQKLQERVDTLTNRTYSVVIRAVASSDISGAVTTAVTNAGTATVTNGTKPKTNNPNRPEARAGGGDVYAGRAYWVGEEGPELVVPKSNGTVIPNDVAGGITINVNGTGDPGMVAEMVYQKLRSSLRGYGGAYAGG